MPTLSSLRPLGELREPTRGSECRSSTLISCPLCQTTTAATWAPGSPPRRQSVAPERRTKPVRAAGRLAGSLLPLSRQRGGSGEVVTARRRLTHLPEMTSGRSRSMVSLDEAAEAARSLPEVVEGERVRQPQLVGVRQGIRLGASVQQGRPPPVRRRTTATRTDPGGAASRTSVKGGRARRSSRLRFTIPHFDGFAAVLIQLQAVTKAVLRELILDGWLTAAPTEVADAYLKRRAPRKR